MKVYIAGDTGPSGFGVATRGLIKSLIDRDIELTVRTHPWGIPDDNARFHMGGMVDTRFEERLIRNGRINNDYLIEDPREINKRREDRLLQDLGSNTTIDREKCLIRDFEGEEDVWLGVGGISFADQAPKRPYTIVSTDFNLDIVPRDWDYYLNLIDELWVPSEWTREAVISRVGEEKEGKVFTMPYGIDMEYEPTEYDCEVCPHNQQNPSAPQRCFRDDTTSLLIISRFYHVKGLFRTLKAYFREFRNGDDIRLFVKTTTNNQFQFNPVQAVQNIAHEVCGGVDTPEIGIGVEPIGTQYLYDLLGVVDGFLQFSRAECFGIAQLQAAYCGTPVAYTNWSAQRELLNRDVDGFIPLDDYEVESHYQEFDNMPHDINNSYPNDAKWATPSIDEIQNIMREIHEMTDEEKERRGKTAREYVKENFKWEDKVDMRMERLAEVKA